MQICTPISRIPSLPAQNGNIYNATGTEIVPAPKRRKKAKKRKKRSNGKTEETSLILFFLSTSSAVEYQNVTLPSVGFGCNHAI